jgi:hypothetical protein
MKRTTWTKCSDVNIYNVSRLTEKFDREEEEWKRWREDIWTKENKLMY